VVPNLASSRPSDAQRTEPGPYGADSRLSRRADTFRNNKSRWLWVLRSQDDAWYGAFALRVSQG